MDRSEFLVHPEPLRRANSDFIIDAPLEDADAPHKYEQFYARKLGENRFELCCVPFFAFGLALGDVVETEQRGDRKYVIAKVVKPSGHATYRVWFGGKKTDQEEVIAILLKLGAEVERSSKSLIAIDAPSSDVADRVVVFLVQGQAREEFMFEIGHQPSPLVRP